MPINIIDTLKPKNNGTFPMVEDGDIKGGFRAVADTTARNAIPTEHRTEGMLVYTSADSTFWQLGSGLTNGDWTVSLAGGGGGGAQGFCVYRPGATSSGGVVGTWTEVAALINASGGLIDVYIDSTDNNPVVDASVDCKGFTRFIGVSRFSVLSFEAPASIQDPKSFEDVRLNADGTAEIISLSRVNGFLTLKNSNLAVSGTVAVSPISATTNNNGGAITIEWINSSPSVVAMTDVPLISCGSDEFDLVLRFIESQDFDSNVNTSLIAGSDSELVQLQVYTDSSVDLPQQVGFGTQTTHDILSTFKAGGDLSGTGSFQVVSKLQGLPIAAGSSAEHGDYFQSVLNATWDGDAPTGLVFDAGTLWVLDSYNGDNNVHRIEVTDINGLMMPIAATIETEAGGPGSSPGRCSIVTDDTHVFVTTGNTLNFYIIEKATSTIVGKGSATSAEALTGIAVNGDDIIVLAPNSTTETSYVYKFSKSDVLAGFPTGVLPADQFNTVALPGSGANYFTDVVYGGGFFWISAVTTDPHPRLYKLNASTMTVGTGAADYWEPALLTTETARSVYYAFGSVWMTTGAGKHVYRFDPSDLSGGAIADIELPSMTDVSYLAADSTTLWVTDTGSTIVARLSTTLGSEAVSDTLTLNGSGCYQPVWDTLNNCAWICRLSFGSAGTISGLQKLIINDLTGNIQDDGFYPGPRTAEWVSPFVFVREIQTATTLQRSDRYVKVTQQSEGANGEYVFLPGSPVSGQTHTILNPLPIEFSVHANGNWIDYNGEGNTLTSLPMYFAGRAVGLGLPISTSITVVWDGDRWRVEAYGGENFALDGEVQGSRRNARVEHIGGYRVEREGIAPIGQALAVVQGSEPKALLMVDGKLFVAREGLSDIFKYDPSTKQRIDRTLPLPTGWTNTCAAASSATQSIWIGEANSGRIAQVTISTAAFADPPSVTRMLMSKYSGTDCMAKDEWNGGILFSKNQTYLAKFDEESHLFTTLATNRGYSSMAVIEGFGYGIAKPTGYSQGRLEKFDLATGDIISFAEPPSPGSSGGMVIGTQVGTKLIIPDSIGNRIFRYDLENDTFDSIAVNVNEVVDGPAFTAWDGTYVIVAGKNAPGTLAQLASAGDAGGPTLGDSISVPGTQFTGLFYDTATSAHIVSDKLGDKLYHFESSLSQLPPPGEAAGLLAMRDLFSSPVVSGTPVYKGTRTTIQSIHTEVQTSSTTEVDCGTFSIPPNTSVAIDIIVTSRRISDNTKRGRWKFSALVSRDATSSAVLDVLDVGSAFNLNAGTVTCELGVANDFKVLVTPADTDDRNWDSEMCVRVGDAT